jgi:hypothetical protein
MLAPRVRVCSTIEKELRSVNAGIESGKRDEWKPPPRIRIGAQVEEFAQRARSRHAIVCQCRGAWCHQRFHVDAGTRDDLPRLWTLCRDDTKQLCACVGRGAGVRLAIQQQPHHVDIPTPRCRKERRRAVLHGRVHDGAAIQQQSDLRHVADRPHQRRRTSWRGGIDISPFIEQSPHSIE